MEQDRTSSLPHGSYRDLPFRLFIALTAAHLIVSFGEKESFFELLLMTDYYRSLAFSFVIAFALVSLVHYITMRLDKQYPWHIHGLIRPLLQITTGLFVPAILAFLFAWAYFRVFGYNILDTPYLKYDFPVIVLMLVLLNAYYTGFYFFRLWRTVDLNIKEPATPKEEMQPQQLVETKNVFIVQRAGKNIPLSIPDIAFFYRDGDYNYLKTVTGDSYLVSTTLDEVEMQLDPKLFFRANRQFITQHKSCTHYTALPFGKLELFVDPSPKEPIIISQKRSKNFKDWMGR